MTSQNDFNLARIKNGLIDSHCHSDHQPEFIYFQQQHQIKSLLNSSTRSEYAFNRHYAREGQKISFGVHPWQADCVPVAHDLLQKADVIGEIGLDNVWTKVPLAVQRPVLIAQLDEAIKVNKPVVIHTKGCESETLSLLQQYPSLTFLIHWYSADHDQEAYLKLPHVFCSVGPDLWTDKVVAAFARKIPLSKLLIESDGLSSISWVTHQKATLATYWQVLNQLMTTLAAFHGIRPEVLGEQLTENWQRFLNPS